MKRALLCLVLSAAPAFAQTDAMTAAANAFYTVYAGQADRGGLPDATGRARLASILTPRLNGLIAQAAQAQDRMTAKVHNAVPPVIEGDIFTSLFEGATSWVVQGCKADGAMARCPVALTYQSKPLPGRPVEKPAHWTDILVLANTPQGWKVDDVVYDAGFAFGNTGRLSDTLAMVVGEEGR